MIGRDEAGRRLRALLAEAGIDDRGVLELAGRPTTIKQRVLAQNKHVLRIDREHSGPIGAAAGRLARRLAQASFDVVVASDYGKGCLTAPLMRRLLETARHAALIANLAAGVVVTKPGTAVASRDEILAHLQADRAAAATPQAQRDTRAGRQRR